VPLAPPVVALLRAHRKTQLEDRMRAANIWQETGHVFTTEESRPIEPRNLLRIVQAAASRIGLTGVGVHTLRHSHASAALEAGRRAQDRVRTPRPQLFAITGDVYAHVSDAAARRRSTSSPRCSESDRCYRSYTRCYTTPREHPAAVG
jgi:integrase